MTTFLRVFWLFRRVILITYSHLRFFISFRCFSLSILASEARDLWFEGMSLFEKVRRIVFLTFMSTKLQVVDSAKAFFAGGFVKV